jgi:hypothetical protein
MLQLRQRVIASYHLGPMDRGETEAYIKHRLGHVGWTEDPAFDASAFDAIFAFAGGIPRKINTLCNRLLLAGYLTESHRFSASDVSAVVAEIQEELGEERGGVYELRAAAAMLRGAEAGGTAPLPGLRTARARMTRNVRTVPRSKRSKTGSQAWRRPCWPRSASCSDWSKTAGPAPEMWVWSNDALQRCYTDREACCGVAGGGARGRCRLTEGRGVSQTIVNSLTVDVEDYFQVSAFALHVNRGEWEAMPCRVEQNVELILQLLNDAGTKATFFTLGWIAERYPQLVRRIMAEGHELASHGYGHHRANDQTRERFLADIELAKAVLEDVSGQQVQGYRAPSFSIGPGNTWAFDCIAEAGYTYPPACIPSSMITTVPRATRGLLTKCAADCWSCL